jgi:hypothetical protein
MLNKQHLLGPLPNRKPKPSTRHFLLLFFGRSFGVVVRLGHDPLELFAFECDSVEAEDECRLEDDDGDESRADLPAYISYRFKSA